jgi:two-component system NtrC family sensor kinase
LDLVDEIRMFARGDTRNYNMLPHQLGTIVERVIRFVSCDVKVRRTKLNYTCIEDLQLILDGDRLRQVLINLIQNAADAVEKNSDPQIGVRVFSKQGYACISVTDNGIGIPKELIRKVFDPLFTTKGENGLGLGLDICMRIVKAHKGELLCTSVEGKGTTFTIMIPIHPTEMDMETTL